MCDDEKIWLRKKEDLKKLFYSNLTEAEIKNILSLDYKQYREMLREVKIELGLPTTYRRKPKRYWKYTEESYYILKRFEDGDFEIISYCPTEETAKIKLNNMNVDLSSYEIAQASDENLLELIREEYMENENNWEGIMQKCKLPYHKFYSLLNTLKRENGIKNNSMKSNRFIYEYSPTQKFVIKKYVDGSYYNFGYYDDLDSAIRMRDYLEGIDWDIELWENNKSNVGDKGNEQ